jgi:DNA-binding response OmpR family regulator
MPVGGRRILLVEDDREILFVLSMFFRGAGYRVNTATSRTRTLRMLARGGFDIVVADTALCGGNAASIAASVQLPVILMSGHPARIAQFAGGPTPFIAKPFRPEELLLLVEQLIGG